MKTSIHLTIGCLLTVATTLLSGCGSQLTHDVSKIPEFHTLNFAREVTYIEEDVDLYVDYSTCVSEAIHSSYYQAVHPAIVDCSPTFFSIKGSEIKEETSDRQKVYELLRSIREVNNAEIRDAVGQIVSKNKQAVLITDGEYYMRGISGDNLNNPYLAEHFRTWLRKGYDIYIYSEPYLESNKYNKFRYYMIFTDSKLDNNIQQKFQRSAPQSDAVKFFHLTNTLPSLGIEKPYPQVNECLSFNSENYVSTDFTECQEYQTSWKDIYKYVLKNAIDPLGNPLPKGDYILKGIHAIKDPNSSYLLEDIDVITYHVYEPYQAFLDSIESGGTLERAPQLEKANKIFVMDEDIFKQTGEIILRLDPMFDGSSLKTDSPNLLKVDFVLKKTKENFSQNEDINKNFKWVSISSRNDGKYNTSVFESINQVLLDKTLAPENHYENPVLYSVYLSTLSN